MQPLAAAYAIALKQHGGALSPSLRMKWAVDRLLAETATPAGKHSRSSLPAVASVAGIASSALASMLAKRRAIQACQSAFHVANGCAPTAASEPTSEPVTATANVRLAFALDYYKRHNGSCSKAVVAEALNLSMRTLSARALQTLALACVRYTAPSFTRMCHITPNTDLSGERNSTTMGTPRYVDSASTEVIVHAITSRSTGTTPVLMSELPGLMQTASDNKSLPSRSTVARFVRSIKRDVRLRRGKAIAIGRATAGQRDAVLDDHFHKLGLLYAQYPVRATDRGRSLPMAGLNGQAVSDGQGMPTTRTRSNHSCVVCTFETSQILCEEPGRIVNSDESPLNMRELQSSEHTTVLMPVYGDNKTHTPQLGGIHTDSEAHVSILARCVWAAGSVACAPTESTLIHLSQHCCQRHRARGAADRHLGGAEQGRQL